MIFQKILPEDIDAVLYMDTDSLFLSNVTEIWEYFVNEHRQHPTAVVTLADHVPPPAKYLYHFRDIPFSGNGGTGCLKLLNVILKPITKSKQYSAGAVRGRPESQDAFTDDLLICRDQLWYHFHEPNPAEKIQF